MTSLFISAKNVVSDSTIRVQATVHGLAKEKHAFGLIRSKPDVYIEVIHNGDVKFKSPVQSSMKPSFNVVFKMDRGTLRPATEFTVKVYDEDVGKDTFYGKAKFAYEFMTNKHHVIEDKNVASSGITVTFKELK